MKIDIDTIITALDVLSSKENKFFHSCIGIEDAQADKILTWAEDIVTGYLTLDGEWDVPDVINDLLVATKFYRLNSPQALFLLLHGYHVLASSLEGQDFFLEGDTVKTGDLPLSPN